MSDPHLPADAAPAPEPGAALLRLVREALDLAAEPVLDPARARRLLGRLLPAVAREIADGGAGALRSGLVTAASTLLAEPEPGVRLATIRSLGSRAARLDWLAARCLPEPAEAEVRALTSRRRR